MADGLALTDQAGAAREERGLTYPFGPPPASGEVVEVAPDVLWMRLAMPIALNHINVYAVRDGDGWALVDTGLAVLGTREEWNRLLAGPLGGAPVTRVPGHLGADPRAR